MSLSDKARKYLWWALTDKVLATELADAVDANATSATLASTAASAGASLVGIQDSAGKITATTVEGALAEIMKYIPVRITDPGTGTAIPVTASATIAITTAAAETNSLAIPTFIGQRLVLYVDTYAVGNRVITASQAINQTGNTIMTFGAARDCITLQAISVGAALRWQVTANDGVALS